jgi:TPR repeat protein
MATSRSTTLDNISAGGCFNLSIAYETGRGVSADNATPQPARSFDFATLACGKNYVPGCVRVEEAKISGKGVDKDVRGGRDQLDAMCKKRQLPAACESLAKLYTNGSGADIAADPLLGHEYLQHACDFGSKKSCDRLKLEANVDTAATWQARNLARFQTQCDGGNAMACGMLGEKLLAAAGTSEDRAKATALIQKGCAGGYVSAACKGVGAGGAP